MNATRSQRPGLIAGLGVYNAVVGLFFMVASVGAPQGAASAFLFGAGLFALVVGIGLFQMQPWARFAAIAGYIVNIIDAFIHPNVLGALIGALILAYLVSPTVKAAFTRQADALSTASTPHQEVNHVG